MKKVFVFMSLITIAAGTFNGGCNQQEFNNAVDVVVNDITGAVGGAELVVATAGTPTTPAQALCVAVWGGIAGATASARTTNEWPGKFNDTVNLVKLHAPYYDPNNPYEQIGIAHNEVLNNYFKMFPESNQRPASLLNNDAGANFMSDYLLNQNSTMRADCETNSSIKVHALNRANMNNTAKLLIEEGMKHRSKIFTSAEDFENYLPAMGLRGSVKNAADVFKVIVNQNYSNTLNDINALVNNCAQEAIRIKNNYYSLTEIEKVYVLSWVATLKYSAIYWNHFRLASKSS